MQLVVERLSTCGTAFAPIDVFYPLSSASGAAMLALALTAELEGYDQLVLVRMAAG